MSHTLPRGVCCFVWLFYALLKKKLYLCAIHTMERKRNIFFVMLTALVLLISPLMPHQHHDKLWCAVTQLCLEDTVCQDGTSHHADQSGGGCYTPCIEDANFISSETVHVFKAISLEDFNPLDHFLPFIVQYSSLVCVDSAIQLPSTYGQYVNTYHSAELVTTNGLRAPPAICC